MNESTPKILIIIKGALLFFLIINPIITRSQNEGFSTFISRFAQDSIFQRQRVCFPLVYVSWNYANDKEDTTSVRMESYHHDRLFYSLEDRGEDAYPVFYDNFDCKFRNSDEMVFQWKGFSSVDRRYYFKMLDGLWYLVKIVDYDPIE